MKKSINSMFPYFDKQALDSARFFFGTNDPKVEWHSGTITLPEFLENFSDEDDNPFEDFENDFTNTIPEGNRNSTLSHAAGRILKRYGKTEKARELFLEKAAKGYVTYYDADGNLKTAYTNQINLNGIEKTN